MLLGQKREHSQHLVHSVPGMPWLETKEMTGQKEALP